MHGQRRSYIIHRGYLSSVNRKQRINKLSIKRRKKAGIRISSVSRRHRSQDLTRMIVNSAPGNLHPSITYRGVLINVSQKDFKSGRVSNYRLVTTSDRAGIAKINSPDSLAPSVRNKGGDGWRREGKRKVARMQCQESGKSDNETSSLWSWRQGDRPMSTFDRREMRRARWRTRRKGKIKRRLRRWQRVK